MKIPKYEYRRHYKLHYLLITLNEHVKLLKSIFIFGTPFLWPYPYSPSVEIENHCGAQQKSVSAWGFDGVGQCDL